VIALPAASAQSPIGRMYGTPRPDTPTAISDMSIRSGRSIRPTSHRKPSPSARAFAYETRAPLARQNSDTPPSVGSCPPLKNHQTSPLNIAASATRSSVESTNAPHFPLVPLILASTPSSMSSSTKIVQVKAPGNNSPIGNKPSAPPDTPTVPMTVTAFGVTGVFASASPTGVSTREIAGRSTFSMAV
jgi:hypothetical protein